MSSYEDRLKVMTQCVEKLKRFRDPEAGASCSKDDICAVFEEMLKVEPLTKEQENKDLLRASGVGVEANHKFFRNHDDESVKKSSKTLIEKWKQACGMGKQATVASPVGGEKPAKCAEPMVKEKTVEKVKVDQKMAEKEKVLAAAEKRQKIAEEANKSFKELKQDKKKKEETGEKRSSTGSDSQPAKKAKADDVANEKNRELVEVFKELASFEFKHPTDGKAKFRGIAYNKVVTQLKSFEKRILYGSDVKHLPGVGPQSVIKIDEFLETGKLDRLERYRNGDFD